MIATARWPRAAWLTGKCSRPCCALHFLAATPPKTAGREQFGREFVSRFLSLCRRLGKHDMMATATALTAESIAASVRMVSRRPASTIFSSPAAALATAA